MKKFFIILLGVFILYGCQNEIDPEIKSRMGKIGIKIDSLISENTKLKAKLNNKTKPYKIWDSFDVGLPQGRIIRKDYAHLDDDVKDLSDNYVSIKQPNGLSIIKRDIDVDTFLNLLVGDSIQ